MNKIKFTALAVLFLTIFSSCSKKDDLTGNKYEIIQKGRMMISLLEPHKDFETRQLSYSLLSPEQRYSLWYAKLSDNAAQNIYTNEQSSKIIELRDYISEQTFTKGDKREIFYSVWFPNFVKQTESIFSSTQFYSLFMTLDQNLKIDDSNPTVNVEEPPLVCKCALNSNFTCPSYSFSLPIGVSVSYGKCEKIGACTATSSGCGALWDNECDGDTCPWNNQST